MCGWSKKPSRSRADISLLTVAEETPTSTDMCEEPTGWAVSTCSVTTAFKIADLRGSSSLGRLRARIVRRFCRLRLAGPRVDPCALRHRHPDGRTVRAVGTRFYRVPDQRSREP